MMVRDPKGLFHVLGVPSKAYLLADSMHVECTYTHVGYMLGLFVLPV